jgi:hypothetical protein
LAAVSLFIEFQLYLIVRIIKLHYTIGEDLRNAQSKFAEIMLAEANAIPAYRLDEFGSFTLCDCDIKDDVPGRIDRLTDCLGGISLVIVLEDKKLRRLAFGPGSCRSMR